MATFMPETFGEMVERVSDSGNPFDLVSNENFALFVSMWLEGDSYRLDPKYTTVHFDELPRVQLYTHTEDGWYEVLDNRDGACLCESYKTIGEALDWLMEKGDWEYV